MQIAVLGLGRMGAPVARSLVHLGHEVHLFDREPGRALQLASETGAKVAGSVAEAAARVSVVLTLVPDDAAEETLTLGPGGLVAHLMDGAVHLCMSSIGMATSARLAAAHEAAGQGYVAAPILGKPALAGARQGWIIAGGPELHLKRCMPLLESLAKGVTPVGPRPELAHALRLGATAMTAAMVESLAEALAVGERAGFPPAEYFRLLNGVLFKSPLLDGLGGLILRRDATPMDMTVDLAAKDLVLWVQAAGALGVSVPGARTLAKALDEARHAGLGDRDITALAQLRPSESILDRPEPEPPPPLAFPEPAPAPEPPQAPLPPPPPPPAVPEPAPEPEPPQAPLPPPPPRRRFKTPGRKEPAAPPPPEPAPEPEPLPPPVPRVEVQEPPRPVAGSEPAYPVRTPEGPREVPVSRTSHFQAVGGVVWAWVEGIRESTYWSSLAEVEQAVPHVLFVRLQPDVLLNPQAILEVQPLFPGRSRVRVLGGATFTVGREVTRNLKFILGI